MTKETEEKRKALNRWLIDEYALVHVATQARDVVIPEYLKNSPTVTLKMSKYFPGKLLVHDHEIEADLRFHGSYFTCRIPFSAVWGIESMKGERKVWMAATPPELLATLVDQQIAPHVKSAPAVNRSAEERGLKLVVTEAPKSESQVTPQPLTAAHSPNIDSDPPVPLPPEPGDKPRRIGRPQLRLVK